MFKKLDLSTIPTESAFSDTALPPPAGVASGRGYDLLPSGTGIQAEAEELTLPSQDI